MMLLKMHHLIFISPAGWIDVINSHSFLQVDGIVEEDKTQTAEIAGLKDVVKKENKTLSDLFQEFEALKVSPHGSLVCMLR